MERNKVTVLCQSEHHKILPRSKHARLMMFFLVIDSPVDPPAAAMNTKGDMSHMSIVQPTKQLRTSPPGSRVAEHMPLYPSCVRLPEGSVSRVMATGALEA